ncbi:T9SS type A sorting domain-containing protein [bacterium]|nr:T9SS type A sorting domain-containing protein [bacterium]
MKSFLINQNKKIAKSKIGQTKTLNMKNIFTIFLTCALIAVTFNLKAQCTTTETLASNITIDVTNSASFTSVISNSGGTSTVNINKNVVVPAGITLTIKGAPGNILNVRFVATAGIKVQPGGLLIIEYCDVSGNGNCPVNPTSSVTTWNGIFVKGDPDEEQYSWYDLTNGWDPYADPFVPGGTYKLNSGGTGFAHGRGQIRFSSFSGIYTEGSTGVSDDNNGVTPYLREDYYGNYAIRSTEGGILNIIDCDFSDVKTAILIDNYTQYPTGDPESSLMNGFQIVDCQFDVSSSQRSNVNDYRFCIELYEAQKVTIEGCVFNSNGSETWNTAMETAIYMKNSSLLMHKSGNFRRSQDFSSGETTLGCPEYGTEMDWTGKDTTHPWHTNSPPKCEFNNFNRAVDAIGESSTDPLHTLALDDVEFNNTYFTVRCEQMVGVTISRSDFSFDEASAGFSVVAEKPLGNSDIQCRLGDEDKVDITFDQCKNTLITECNFSSNYNGLGSQTGKNVYIQLHDLPNGNFSNNNYELIYKNTFNPTNNGEDFGVWLNKESEKDKAAHVLFNCNTFQYLDCAVFVGDKKTKLCDQFHYTDIGGGMDAAAQNTFTSNDCDFDAYYLYDAGTATYYRLTSEVAPNDCEANGSGMAVVNDLITIDDPECKSLTCTKFPMKLSVDGQTPSVASIFPNPSNCTFTIQFARPMQKASISIIDLTGKVVYQKQIGDEVEHITINPHLSSGYYSLMVTTADGTFTNKLVIE